jgi:hypothetical protein
MSDRCEAKLQPASWWTETEKESKDTCSNRAIFVVEGKHVCRLHAKVFRRTSPKVADVIKWLWKKKKENSLVWLNLVKQFESEKP